MRVPETREGSGGIILGVEDERISRAVRKWYAQARVPLLLTSHRQAEMMQQVWQTYRAAVSSIENDFASLAERWGMDWHLIRKGIGIDPAIGQNKHLEYEGGTPLSSVSLSWRKRQLEWLDDQLHEIFPYHKGQVMAVWGKDSWQALADPIKRWLDRGIRIQLYLSEASAVPAGDFGLKIANDRWQAAEQADILLIIDSDDESLENDMQPLKECMRDPVVLDACAQFEPLEMKALGIRYRSIGRG